MSKESNGGQGPQKNNVYESQASLSMYLSLHYPSSGEDEKVPPMLPHDNAPLHGLRFPQRVAELLVRLRKETEGLEPLTTTSTAALDIGCAVGGSSFELAKTFSRVDAFDYSESFVSHAIKMQSNEEIAFRVPLEADIYTTVKAVHEKGVTPEVKSKVNFFVGDACAMPKMIQDGRLQECSYDGVILSNLLCRLPDPMGCLNALPELVKEGGVVVIVTPFSWLEEFTMRDKWLGGYYVDRDDSQAPSSAGDDRCVYSKHRLRHVMEKLGFEAIHEEQMPLIIREHQRKYQYIISEATGWKRLSKEE